MVCAVECEVAEERSDDEAYTLQVPEQSEGKTKEIKQQHLPFTVLKLYICFTRKLSEVNWLQQHLLLAVLKQFCNIFFAPCLEPALQ